MWSSRSCVDSQTTGNLAALERINVQHPQQLVIVIGEIAKRLPDLVPPRLVNQSDQRVLFVPVVARRPARNFRRALCSRRAERR